MSICDELLKQGEMNCLLIPNPSNMNFPWCPKDKPPDFLEKMSPLIQINAQNSSFHIDPSGMPGFISMSSFFSDDICKICFVASRDTSTLRRYLKIVAAAFNKTKRNISQETIVSECLDLVERGDMTMDLLFPDNTGHFLKNALYHFVVTVCRQKPLGTANISFMTGAYSSIASGPPLLSMDPEQDPEDKYRKMVYSEVELDTVEVTHKKKCLESTKSLTSAREVKKKVKSDQSRIMLQNRKSSKKKSSIPHI
jgi:hypothetical protein